MVSRRFKTYLQIHLVLTFWRKIQLEDEIDWTCRVESVWGGEGGGGSLKKFDKHRLSLVQCVMNTSTCWSPRIGWLSPAVVAGIWTLDWFMGKFTAHYTRPPAIVAVARGSSDWKFIFGKTNGKIPLFSPARTHIEHRAPISTLPIGNVFVFNLFQIVYFDCVYKYYFKLSMSVCGCRSQNILLILYIHICICMFRLHSVILLVKCNLWSSSRSISSEIGIANNQLGLEPPNVRCIDAQATLSNLFCVEHFVCRLVWGINNQKLLIKLKK